MTRPCRVLACLVCLAMPVAGFAQSSLLAPALAPQGTVTATETQPNGTLAIATGPWTAGAGTPQRLVAGKASQTAYRLADPSLSTQAMLAPLREGLLAEGFAPLFECETRSCGGFDFRYDLPLLAEPAMHVDLGDFRYFAAMRNAGSGPAEAVMIIVSRSQNAGFVQISRVEDVAIAAATVPPLPADTSTASAPVASVAPVPTPVAGAAGDIARRLEAGGAFALDDLVFPSGAAELAPGDYASLNALAGYLAANPNRQIAIVGHTDASGGLAANITLSRRRAQSVRRVLIETLDTRPAQVQAEGVGYLSPRTSNLTAAGRAANRRVEVMLTSTE